MPVPALRIQPLNRAPLRPSADFVLYWMVAARRPTYNFALDRAIELCASTGKPLLVLEALTSGYRWASDRIHSFVLAGMADNRDAFRKAGVTYYPYVEAEPQQGKGLVEALAERAVAVVTDDFPCFFLPRLVHSLAARLPVRVEAVDSNGIVPLRAAPRSFARAVDFRRFLGKVLFEHAPAVPSSNPPWRRARARGANIPPQLLSRWPLAPDTLLTGTVRAMAHLPIDHSVPPGALRGGASAACEVLADFCANKLSTYAEQRQHPDAEVSSGLSPYLHFGQISAHQIFASVLGEDELEPQSLEAPHRATQGPFFQLRSPIAAFLDQLVTWRELAYNFCLYRPDDCATYASIPSWAQSSLVAHQKDPREKIYSDEQLEQAMTSDPLWNAAQRELVRTGRMHNYLRMLWGKRVLNWKRRPEQAFSTLVELNNKYALDGRDPSSYAGISWCFGHFDRPWGPERPVYGLVRYMTSESARRKLHLSNYLARWA